MKKFLKNLDDSSLTLLIQAIVGIVFILISLVGFFFGKPGWTIGVVSGVAIALLSSLLVLKGTEATLRDGKTGLFLASSFVRMFLFVGVIGAYAYLWFMAKVSAFEFAVWGAVIGYSPMFLVMIIGQFIRSARVQKQVSDRFNDK